MVDGETLEASENFFFKTRHSGAGKFPVTKTRNTGYSHVIEIETRETLEASEKFFFFKLMNAYLLR